MFVIVAHHMTCACQKHLAWSCQDLSGLVEACWGCWDLSGLVRSLLGLVGTCREVVRTCQELSGGIGNVDFMESHFEGIAIVVDIILDEFLIPEILWSVPAKHDTR